MPEWLQEAFTSDIELSLWTLIFRLFVSLALGCVVAGIYHLTHGKRDGQAVGLLATLVMLTVLIAMITLVIGNSVARAFSLVGALAIVRFRTVVEDTRDTAFVIFAVGVGMAVGAGYLRVPLAGIPVAAAAAFLFRYRLPAAAANGAAASLIVRVGVGRHPDELVREPFAKHLQSFRLVSTATARQGAAIELTYQVRMRDAGSAIGLVTDLNGMEGVQGVEIRQT